MPVLGIVMILLFFGLSVGAPTTEEATTSAATSTAATTATPPKATGE